MFNNIIVPLIGVVGAVYVEIKIVQRLRRGKHYIAHNILMLSLGPVAVAAFILLSATPGHMTRLREITGLWMGGFALALLLVGLTNKE